MTTVLEEKDVHIITFQQRLSMHPPPPPSGTLLVNFSTMSPVVLALMKVSVCLAKDLKKFLLS